jgi:hypothetical protein
MAQYLSVVLLLPLFLSSPPMCMHTCFVCVRVILGLELRSYASSQSTSLFFFFLKLGTQTICLELALNHDPPDLCLCVDKITAVSHQHLALAFFFFLTEVNFISKLLIKPNSLKCGINESCKGLSIANCSL